LDCVGDCETDGVCARDEDRVGIGDIGRVVASGDTERVGVGLREIVAVRRGEELLDNV
jgi:hypothetical protein